MVRRIIGGFASFVVVLSFLACGGGGSSGTPTGPTSSPPPTGVTIEIRSATTAQPFSPNPATLDQAGIVAWRNTDSDTHQIVANDGSFDTGVIAPGATSRTLTLARGTNYHCALHTTMVGAIGIALEPPPECTGPYC